VEWYLEEPDVFVEWVDADEYRGRGWSNGAWVVDFNTVNAHIQQCQEEVNTRSRRYDDALRFKTLEDWLRADINGELVYRGAKGGMDDVAKTLRIRVPSEKGRCQTCRKIFGREPWWRKNCPACTNAAKNVRRAKQLPYGGATARGVYGTPRRLVAVSSKLKEIASRDRPDGGAAYRAAVDALWDELDRVDPLKRRRGK
jgi:hypothetical protein